MSPIIENMSPVTFHILCTMFCIAAILEAASTCPSQLCICNVDNEVICSSKRLERVPHFTSRTSDKIYDVLDLSQNEIESIPPFAFQNVQAKAILLNRNPLIGISPRAFNGQEDVLEKLDLYDTELYVMHWGVLRNLHSLRELNLGRNGMFALPVGLFDGVINLEDLSLTWNKIATIKAGFFRNLAMLRSLNLLGNLISEIEPGAFSNLRQLKTLNLNSNQIKNINPLSLQGLHNLERLLLEGNLLMEVPSGIFILLPNIKSINLAKNNISIMSSRSFNGAFKLEEIIANENAISNISSMAFIGLPNLKKLKLDDNKLQTVGEDCILQGVQSIKELSLQNNPVECSCRIAWIDELNSKGTKVFGQCVSPVPFSGIQLSRLNFTLCDTFICG